MDDERKINELSPELRASIVRTYRERFATDVIAVHPGVNGLLGGSLAIAVYKPEPDELISDVVYIDSLGQPMVFQSTQELLLFMERKQPHAWFNGVIQSKMFHAMIFAMLLVAVFWAGYEGPQKFDSNALAVLGSVVGLAAGLFFGQSRHG